MQDRLARLERHNRRLTLAVTTLGLALASTLLMGAIRRPTDEVQCKALIVLDDKGNRRALLGVAEADQVALTIADSKERTRSSLFVADNSAAGLSIKRPKDHARVILGVDPDSRPALKLTSEADKPVFLAP